MNAAPDMRVIARALGLRSSSGGLRGDCPACGYSRSFSVSVRDGRVLYWCASCTDRIALTAAVRAAAGGAATAPSPVLRPKCSARGPAEARERARELWDAGLPVPNTPAATYLKARGVPHLAACPDLRFLAWCPHPSRERFPALLAAVRDVDGEFVALHRTFLSLDGRSKAAIDPPRASLGPMLGAAVHLTSAASHMLVGEGIETVASASALLDLPGWAATSAGGLAEMELPQLVRHVTIAADHDPAGRRAADAAARRWRAQGRAVRIALPNRPGADFNDVVMEEGNARG